MLEIKDLVKKYGDKTALNGINIHIEKGEIVGLLGLNGAGKSTTMNCITGYIAPTEGTIIIGGRDILKEPAEARRVIGYLPEVFSFYPDMKVCEYLDFVCDLKGFTKNRAKRKAHIEEVCQKAGLSKMTGRMIRNLSKGYKQRTGFAQALIANPKVLILDEPTVGLDPSQIIEIRQMIKEQGKESTVIVSSHILSEIQAICTRIIVIHNGKIAFDSKKDESMLNDNKSMRVRIRGSEESFLKKLRELDTCADARDLGSKEEGSRDLIVTGSGGRDIREDIFKAAASEGITLLMMSEEGSSLESAFLAITGQDVHESGEE